METKLYTKADVKARKEAQNDGVASEDAMSEAITKGLGGKKNISDVDCCATRLRCTVHDAASQRWYFKGDRGIWRCA